MHGEAVGVGQTLPVAFGYLLLAGFLRAMGRFGIEASTLRASTTRTLS